MNKLNYFAFGSNLSSRRLRHRLPRVRIHGVALLARHELCWHKNDGGRSGKCDIDFTDLEHHVVYGVIYHLTPDEQRLLDEIEGHGHGYERRNVRVETIADELLDAFTYYALDIDHSQRPYHWYKEHVLRGAMEHGFPAHYIETIRQTPSIDDHDEARHRRELAIYPGD